MQRGVFYLLMLGGAFAFANSKGKGFAMNAASGAKGGRDKDEWLAGTVSDRKGKKKKAQ